MTSRVARLFPVLLALFALRMPAHAAEPKGDAGEIEKLERELVAAIAAKDLAAYDRLVADDYVAFDAAGKANTKADIMAGYRSGARGYTGLEIFDVQGRIFGDTGVVSARTKGFRREGGQDVPNNVQYIRVYARREGRWRAVAQKSAPVVPAPAP